MRTQTKGHTQLQGKLTNMVCIQGEVCPDKCEVNLKASGEYIFDGKGVFDTGLFQLQALTLYPLLTYNPNSENNWKTDIRRISKPLLFLNATSFT